MNRARIEALWQTNPRLTQEQVRRATGAPSAVVKRVQQLLVAAGKLDRPRRDYLRTVGT